MKPSGQVQVRWLGGIVLTAEDSVQAAGWLLTLSLHPKKHSLMSIINKYLPSKYQNLPVHPAKNSLPLSTIEGMRGKVAAKPGSQVIVLSLRAEFTHLAFAPAG